MKKKLIFVTVLILALVLFYNLTKSDVKMIVRTAFSQNAFQDIVKDYDPQRNLDISRAFLTCALYLTMIDYGAEGELKTVALESFYFNGSDLRLKVNKKLKTSKGRSLNIKDLEYSVRRLLYKNNSLHGNLSEYLCGTEKINSFFDKCDGLRVEGDELILKVKNGINGGLLIPWLATVDFPIIPYDAMDVNSDDIDIVDFSNTTGAFYTDSKLSSDSLNLKRNIYSDLFSYDKYDLKLVLYKDFEHLKELSLTNNLDLIPTFGMDELFTKSIVANDENALIYQTQPISVMVLNFKERGIKKLSLKQRSYFGNKLKQFFKDKFDKYEWNSYENEIYPKGSDLSLSLAQKAELDIILNKEEQIISEINVAVINKHFEVYLTEFAKLYKLPINVINLNGAVILKSEKDSRIDVAFGGFDTGHFESLSGINYEINIGVHGPRHQADMTIKEYLQSNTKEDRLESMRRLQFRTLKNIYSYPVYSEPYFSVTFNGWKAHFNPYLAISQVWQLQKL